MTDDLISRNVLKNEIHKTLLEIADTPLRDDYTSKLALRMGELILKKIDEAPAVLHMRKG